MGENICNTYNQQVLYPELTKKKKKEGKKSPLTITKKVQTEQQKSSTDT